MYSNMDSAGETISVLDELLKQNLLSCIQIQLNTEINNNNIRTPISLLI